MALDRNPSTFQHFYGNATGSHWWKVKFNTTVFVTKVEIVNRGQCCQERSNNIDIMTTLVARGQRHDTVCANVGILGDAKTVDCNRFADEMTIVKNGPDKFNLAEVYIFGTVH